MAILRYWNDENDSRPFLRVEALSLGESSGVQLRVAFRREQFEESMEVSHTFESDSSHTWLLMLAGNLQYAASVSDAKEFVEWNLKQPWEPVMWTRTDFLTIIVIPNKKVPSLPHLRWAHIFLESDSEAGLFYFFVVRSTPEQLAEFGRTLFAELKALPGFDPETIDYYEKKCPNRAPENTL